MDRGAKWLAYIAGNIAHCLKQRGIKNGDGRCLPAGEERGEIDMWGVWEVENRALKSRLEIV